MCVLVHLLIVIVEVCVSIGSTVEVCMPLGRSIPCLVHYIDTLFESHTKMRVFGMYHVLELGNGFRDKIPTSAFSSIGILHPGLHPSITPRSKNWIDVEVLSVH